MPKLPKLPKPDAEPGVIRILLSEAASLHLSRHGEECFAVVGRATYPDNPRRWAIYLLPCGIEAANDGTAVARGTHRAVRIRKSVDMAASVTGGS